MGTDFSIQDLPMEGVRLITPFYKEDERGFFLKNFEKEVFQEWGISTDISEDFESYSRKGVIRGLHFQTKAPQIKVVRAIHGIIHDVIVDLRRDSKTFGRYMDVVLSGKDHRILCIPQWFAHGFEVLSEDAVVSYKCMGRYLEGYDTGIRWDDKDLAIKWETKSPILSPKDTSLMSFQDFLHICDGLSWKG